MATCLRGVPGACDDAGLSFAERVMAQKRKKAAEKLPPSEVIFKFSHLASYQAALSLQAALKGRRIPPLSAVLLTIPARPVPVQGLLRSGQADRMNQPKVGLYILRRMVNALLSIVVNACNITDLR